MFPIRSSDNMTIPTQNDLTLEDNICQAISTFKKLLSTSSTSLANGKGYHSKHIHFSINAYRKDKKHNEGSARHKHRPGQNRKK